MPVYRVHFLNQAGRAFASDHFECERDSEAIQIAHEMFEPSVSHGFELWRDTRIVHVHSSPKQEP
ncbi:MAG: hypothetical protein EPO08_17910 [Rhodospirillaceae bacterium]|nr:MAG: hypothetical protein EPO08_17910 [Rhodospirillaceae bacterium]